MLEVCDKIVSYLISLRGKHGRGVGTYVARLIIDIIPRFFHLLTVLQFKGFAESSSFSQLT
jgi:hypothetical protein